MRSYDVGLSWAEHDLTDGDTPSPGRIPALDELLATLAEAPDLASSAAFLLSRLGELSGSSRGFVRLLDPAMELLAVVASVGLEEGEVPRALSINELSHPIVVSALSLHPIRAFRSGNGSRCPCRAGTTGLARRRSPPPASRI